MSESLIFVQFGNQDSSFPLLVPDVHNICLRDLRRMLSQNSGVAQNRIQFVAGITFDQNRSKEDQEYETLASLGVYDGSVVQFVESDESPVAPIVQQQQQYQPEEHFDTYTPPSTTNNNTFYQQQIDEVPIVDEPVTSFKLLEFLGYEPAEHQYIFENVTFDTAFDAAKREGKILFAVLYSSKEEVSLQYCTEILTHEFCLELAKEQFIMYFVDTQHPQVQKLLLPLQRIVERSGQFSEAMLDFSNLPITSFMCYFDGSTSILDVVHGHIEMDALVPKVMHLLEVQGSVLPKSKPDNVPLSSLQQLLNEQDAQYQNAIRQDMEKQALAEKLKQEALAKQQAAEQEALAKQQAALQEAQTLANMKETKTANLPKEPTSGAISTLRIRLLDGKQVARKFASTDPVSVVFDFLFVTFDLHPEKIQLVSQFPKATFANCNEATSLQDAKLAPQAQLFVQEK